MSKVIANSKPRAGPQGCLLPKLRFLFHHRLSFLFLLILYQVVVPPSWSLRGPSPYIGCHPSNMEISGLSLGCVFPSTHRCAPPCSNRTSPFPGEQATVTCHKHLWYPWRPPPAATSAGTSGLSQGYPRAEGNGATHHAWRFGLESLRPLLKGSGYQGCTPTL